MADFPTTARVVVIGGGAVGTSVLYHLAERGWSDCVLLEKSELTAGSTWHAAGNCPTFSASWTIMAMQAYSVSLFERLGDVVGYPINYHQTGSIRLAHGYERMREFAHVIDMARSQGFALDLLEPSDIKARYPHIELHDIVGGLWDPRDGDIDPSQLTQAFATGARNGGAKIIRGAPVTAIGRAGDEWVVTTPKGTIRCEKVVNAAGYYSQDIAAMFLVYGGRMIPQTVMAHQYLVTEEIPALVGAPKLPLLRDPDSSYYLRQEKAGLLLGPYENGGRIHWQSADDPRPDDFSFQLFPDDLERIESYIEDACARVPILGSVGLQRVINGPIPYAPDGNPLIGPMPGVRNAYEATAFTFGIVQSGGAGRLMAEWIVEGETELDAFAVDPRRFTGFADQDYANAKGKQIYDNEYAIGFPRLEWPAGRMKRLSPNHDILASEGAVFSSFSGWERAGWFAEPGDNTDAAACATFDREGPWFKAVARECAAVEHAAGILDLTGLTRFHLSGPGAAEWLAGRIAGKLPGIGRVRLAYFETPKGKFAAEMTVTRRAENDFLLMTAAVAEWRDGELLRHSLPADGSVTMETVTEEAAIVLVTGPASREILSRVIEADLTLGWLSHQVAHAGGRAFDLLRVSYAGELGWELHLPQAVAAGTMSALLAVGKPLGARSVGMVALDALRLEKGYLSWGSDLSGDYTLADLGVAGRAPSDKMLVSLEVEAGLCDPPPLSSVWHKGRQVGLVTSSGYGHRVRKTLALAVIDREASGAVEVDVFGTRHAATISPTPTHYDPANERLKA